MSEQPGTHEPPQKRRDPAEPLSPALEDYGLEK